MENMELYESFRKVPECAQKKIGGGKLKGFTDINPMWRIKQLTERFGPCGTGWKAEIVKQWTETGSDGRVMAFCNVNLFYRTEGEVNTWSLPVPGTGGSMMTDIEKGNLVSSDEAHKMAYTDALSVCCKMLGMGADVYWQNDRDKYTKNDAVKSENVNLVQTMLCEECGAEIVSYLGVDGRMVSAAKHASRSVSVFGRCLCLGCIQKVKESRED